MAGNSNRRGAIKKSGKGNPTAGSGGRRRKGLEGKGPTPRAEERPNHKAYKMARAADKRESSRPKRKNDGGPEWVAGRNSVLELLLATVPVMGLYIAEGLDRDEVTARAVAAMRDNRLYDPMEESITPGVQQLMKHHPHAAAKIKELAGNGYRASEIKRMLQLR